jgi:hypothetical protein
MFEVTLFVKRLAYHVKQNILSDINLSLKDQWEIIIMYNPYKRESDAIEKFRIKAHLRSYVKDPIRVDEKLLEEAVIKLKKLPYDTKDPADTVAIELLQSGYRSGCFKNEDLTDNGRKLVRNNKYRRRHRSTIERANHALLLRNRFTLRSI